MGIEPDIVTLSKSISGYGLPMALVLMKPEHDVWAPAEHNGTFRGNTHAFVTANVMLEKFWSDDAFSNQMRLKAGIVTRRLESISMQVDGFTLKGRGMMQGVSVGSGELADKITRLCFIKGLICETSGPHDEVIKILAPLTTPLHLLERGLNILEDATCEIIGKHYSPTVVPLKQHTQKSIKRISEIIPDDLQIKMPPGGSRCRVRDSQKSISHDFSGY
jgi:diaminobutyrate-2-oxoglutarate transaminase